MIATSEPGIFLDTFGVKMMMRRLNKPIANAPQFTEVMFVK